MTGGLPNAPKTGSPPRTTRARGPRDGARQGAPPSLPGGQASPVEEEDGPPAPQTRHDLGRAIAHPPDRPGPGLQVRPRGQDPEPPQPGQKAKRGLGFCGTSRDLKDQPGGRPWTTDHQAPRTAGDSPRRVVKTGRGPGPSRIPPRGGGGGGGGGWGEGGTTRRRQGEERDAIRVHVEVSRAIPNVTSQVGTPQPTRATSATPPSDVRRPRARPPDQEGHGRGAAIRRHRPRGEWKPEASRNHASRGTHSEHSLKGGGHRDLCGRRKRARTNRWPALARTIVTGRPRRLTVHPQRHSPMPLQTCSHL